MARRSMLGDLGVLFLAGSLIALVRLRPVRKLAYIGIGVALFVGVMIFVDNWVLGWVALFVHSWILHFLLNPFHIGFSSDLAAVGLIASSLGVMLSLREGLKTWTAQFIPATCVVIVAVLALVGTASMFQRYIMKGFGLDFPF